MRSLIKVLLAGAALAVAIPAFAQQGPGHGGHMGGGRMGGDPMKEGAMDCCDMDGPMGSARMLERLDTDKDGSISKEEFSARRVENFKTMDPDGDGRITKAELPEAMERLREARRREQMERSFSELDKNGDGAVTQDEFLAAGNDRFERMDRNDDGKLTPQDRRRR